MSDLNSTNNLTMEAENVNHTLAATKAPKKLRRIRAEDIVEFAPHTYKEKKDGARQMPLLDYQYNFPKKNGLVDRLDLATLRIFVEVTFRKGHSFFRCIKPKGV